MTAARPHAPALAEYKVPPRPAPGAEKLRGFERRMAEAHGRRPRHLANELPDEFLNREAMARPIFRAASTACATSFKGDLARAEQEMERMSQAPRQLGKGMEQNLRRLPP